MTSPVALVLDDVHVLRNAECRAALSALADHVPGGSRLVLAGRDEPPLRIARLRAEGKLLEIGPGDLSLTPGEAASLLDAWWIRDRYFSRGSRGSFPVTSTAAMPPSRMRPVPPREPARLM